MKKNIDLIVVAVYDRKSGQYGQPIVQTNEETSIRYFNWMMSKSENAIIAGDVELYKIGTYDPITGALTPIEDKPIYMCDFGGGVNV